MSENPPRIEEVPDDDAQPLTGEPVAELEHVIHQDSLLIHLVADCRNRCIARGVCSDALPFRSTPFAARLDQSL